MFLAPQVEITVARSHLADGVRGVRQTLGAMRQMVERFKASAAIRQCATSIVFLAPEKNERAEIEALFHFVRDSIRYTRDIHDVETLSTPDKTLAGRFGDCDDQVTLLCTLLESVGYPTRFVIAGYQGNGDYSHVYCQCFDGADWIDLDPTEMQPMGWAAPNPSPLSFEVV